MTAGWPTEVASDDPLVSATELPELLINGVCNAEDGVSEGDAVDRADRVAVIAGGGEFDSLVEIVSNTCTQLEAFGWLD